MGTNPLPTVKPIQDELKMVQILKPMTVQEVMDGMDSLGLRPLSPAEFTSLLDQADLVPKDTDLSTEYKEVK